MNNQYTVAELAGIHDSLRRLVAIAAQSPSPQSSVEIEQSAKPGQPPRCTVKVYHEDPTEAASRATVLFDILIARYRAASETRGVRPDAIQL